MINDQYSAYVYLITMVNLNELPVYLPSLFLILVIIVIFLMMA